MEQSKKNYKRIVIKIGSSLLCSDGINWDKELLVGIAAQVSSLIREKYQVAIVSSGAIALGMHVLGLKSRPKELPQLQAAASLGQNLLMDAYGDIFRKNRINPAQILLTWEDFNDRRRYLNAKNTLLTLLRMGHIIPIINENDTISTEEIKFGDNDRLSALVSSLISSDILVILSDIDGLWDKEKNIIPVVSEINAEIKSLACPTSKKACVGGMITKIEAAEIAVNSGIPCVITNGRKKDAILSVLTNPEKHGTIFLSKKGLAERERWIAFNARPKGRIFIDKGAIEAITKNNCSLLSPGIVNIEGNFAIGDVVEILSVDNVRCARGITNVGSHELKAVIGKKYHKEIVHKNNIVIK